jgi:1,4-dihydroxy-2-naphthoate octaprenyltransferase
MSDPVPTRWLKELRAPFFTASIAPVLLGAAVSWAKGFPFSWGLFILTLLGGVLLHAGANVSNDYFDHRSGTDDINVDFVNPFTGGSRMIQDGLMTPRQVLVEAIVLYALAALIGVYLITVRGWAILLLGVAGIVSGFFYTAPPFRFVHNGMGEVLIGLNFGVLMTLGAYYVQAGSFDPEPIMVSIPVALLITAVLYINQFQDFTADRAVGKDHLVVRLGKKKARIGYILIIGSAYVWILVAAVSRRTSPYTLIALLTLPIAVKAVRTLLVHYERSEELMPANAGTIMVHASMGALLTIAYVLDKLL